MSSLYDKFAEMVREWVDHALREPVHLAIEFAFLVIIIFLYTRKPYDAEKKANKRTKKDEEELVNEWKPEPLISDKILKELTDDSCPLTLHSASDSYAIVDGKRVLNMAGNNFLGFATNKQIKDECRKTIDKYGVGSCGPRGFYGSIDVHLELEKEMANFFGVEESILYSDSLFCAASVIPAFAKRGDMVVCDEGVFYGFQQGMNLSRSQVHYFKHNDMADLERVLQKLSKDPNSSKVRRFVVVEGVYQDFGDIAPLKKIVELKNKFKFRLIVDDTLGVGVLGKTGRGSFEHHGLRIQDIDIMCGSLDAALTSTGGFCVGLPSVVDHQRLSGVGYCFSAASPPYTATAATQGFRIINSEAAVLCADLRKRAASLRKLLAATEGLVLEGGVCESPVLHLRLAPYPGRDLVREEKLLRAIAAECLEKHVVITVPLYIPEQAKVPTPSLRLSVIFSHTENDLKIAADVLKAAVKRHLAKL